MKIRIEQWSGQGSSRIVDSFVKRPPFRADAEKTARTVLEDIRKRGAAAVSDYCEKFDRVRLKAGQFAVSSDEVKAANKFVDADFRKAARESKKRISAFSRAGMKKNWSMKTPGGGQVGERFYPLDRVGVYIPGGSAPLVSTALMTITLAKVAGVKEIVACSPCNEDGDLNPYLLYAIQFAGATEIYKVGGVQAVGLMAYGTRAIPKVNKIVGPGGAFVTAAKKCVYGDVALDLVAGPSEICVLADSSASPVHVAADLLSQAEHGTGDEKALLVTTSKAFAGKVAKEITRQTATLTRKKLIEAMAAKGILLVVVPSLNKGVELCNAFAAEHLEIMTKNPGEVSKKITCAGAIFVGPWAPDSAGDFVAGPSHVLPTGGAARMFSGLTVDDFRRRSSVIAFTRRDLEQTLPVIEAFGRVEGLDGHARSAVSRFRDI